MNESNNLVRVLNGITLPQIRKDELLKQFAENLGETIEVIENLKDEATMIVIDSTTAPENIHDLTAKAKKLRLVIADKRIKVEKVRKAMKESSLREGQLIDGIARVLREKLEPLETYLNEQERFFELQALEKERILREERLEQVRPFINNMESFLATYNISKMSDADFSALLAKAKAEHLTRIENAKTAKRLEEEALQKSIEDKRKQLTELTKKMATASAKTTTAPTPAPPAGIQTPAPEVGAIDLRDTGEGKVVDLGKQMSRMTDEDKQKLLAFANVLEGIELPDDVESARAEDLLNQDIIPKLLEVIRTIRDTVLHS